MTYCTWPKCQCIEKGFNCWSDYPQEEKTMADLTIHLSIANKIKDLGPKVHEKVVDAVVNRELDKRSTAIVKAIDDLDKLSKQFKKLGPDIISYDEKGAKISENFSKARIDERNKASGKIDKWTKALNKALESSDFGDLYNLGTTEDKGGSGEETK